MVYGETGRYPLSIFLKKGIVMYWTKLLTAHKSKLTRVIYWYCYTEDLFEQPYIKCVGDILNSSGLSYDG